jgi:hypothetical protein
MPGTSAEEIAEYRLVADFPGMRIFTMTSTGVEEICRSGVSGPVPQNFFYGDLL